MNCQNLRNGFFFFRFDSQTEQKEACTALFEVSLHSSLNSTCPWVCSRRTSTFPQREANTHCKTSRGTLDVCSPPSDFTLRSRRNAASYSLCWGNMSYNFTLGKLLNWELLVWHRSCLRNPMVLLIQRGFERVVMKNIASPFESASRLLSFALLNLVY